MLFLIHSYIIFVNDQLLDAFYLNFYPAILRYKTSFLSFIFTNYQGIFFIDKAEDDMKVAISQRLGW